MKDREHDQRSARLWTVKGFASSAISSLRHLILFTARTANRKFSAALWKCSAARSRLTFHDRPRRDLIVLFAVERRSIRHGHPMGWRAVAHFTDGASVVVPWHIPSPPPLSAIVIPPTRLAHLWPVLTAGHCEDDARPISGRAFDRLPFDLGFIAHDY